MSAKLKEKKVIAGIVAVAILAVVLVLTIPLSDNDVADNNEIPDNNVAATVNGEKIMQEDVAELQELYAAQGMPISEEEALEQLIMQEVVYQAAELGDYIPTSEEAKQELEAQLAMMGMTMEDFQEQLEAVGLSYEEYLEDFRAQLAIEDYLYDAVEVPGVTEEEARKFYEDWKQMLPEEQEPPPFEEIESEIIMHLEQEKQQEVMFDLIDELMAEADVEYM